MHHLSPVGKAVAPADAELAGHNESRPASHPMSKAERAKHARHHRAAQAARILTKHLKGKRDIPAMSMDWTAVIISSSGLLDTTLNWLHHFAALNLKMPLVLVCEDKALADEEWKALKKYRELLNFRVVRAGSAGAEAEHYFGSDGYNKIVSRRGYHLRNLLQEGKDIIYSDVDTVWIKDPRPYLRPGSGENRMMWGAPGFNGYHPEICTGFLAVRSTPETTRLMQMWGDALNDGQDRNQPMFNEILKNRSGEHGVTDVGVLYESNFPRGDQYFLKKKWNRKPAVVVHASWIKGNDEKVKAFSSKGLWNPS